MIISEIIYFIITIGVLVFIHEFGHFIAAKLSGMRTEAFAIGFGYRLFGFNKISGFSFGNLPEDFDGQGYTDYRLCAVPLGGYVKISGMVDESFDTQFADAEPKPYEFRSKPMLSKIFVISAGVIMNLLLAFVIFTGISYVQGKAISKTTTVAYIEPGTAAEKIGFKTNDKILSVNGKSFNNWEDIRSEIFVTSMGQDVRFEIQRGSEKLVLIAGSKVLPQDESERLFLVPVGYRAIIGDVAKNQPAEASGLKAGDIIISINNEQVYTAPQTIKLISSNKEKEVKMAVLRSKDTVKMAVTPSKEGKIGIAMAGYVYLGETEKDSYTLMEAAGNGTREIQKMTKLTFSMFSRVASGQVEFKKAFGGPIKIAQYAAKSADTGLINFLFFLGMLSLSLAIINIMPFPVLDGGHLVIILIEGIIQRELSIKIKIYIQNTGFVLLLLLMGFIIFNDITSLRP